MSRVRGYRITQVVANQGHSARSHGRQDLHVGWRGEAHGRHNSAVTAGRLGDHIAGIIHEEGVTTPSPNQRVGLRATAIGQNIVAGSTFVTIGL